MSGWERSAVILWEYDGLGAGLGTKRGGMGHDRIGCDQAVALGLGEVHVC